MCVCACDERRTRKEAPSLHRPRWKRRPLLQRLMCRQRCCDLPNEHSNEQLWMPAGRPYEAEKKRWKRPLRAEMKQ